MALLYGEVGESCHVTIVHAQSITYDKINTIFIFVYALKGEETNLWERRAFFACLLFGSLKF